MASIILRKLCSRGSRNVRFYYNLSFRSTQSLPVLVFNRGCIANRLCYNRRQILPSSHVFCKQFSDDNKKLKKKDEVPKLSIFKRFKQMYRDYWYVLVPVHVVTSIGWFGSFYYLAKSGVDIATLMESWHVSDVIINPLRDSSMGYLAVAYALYKIFTPLRYMVTLGGTTISIKYLKEWGYIKPVPSAKELKDMYAERRDNIIQSVKDRTSDLKVKTDQFKEKKNEIIEDIEKGIKLKIEDAKEQIKEKKDLLDDLKRP
ncbi:hypothetical protein AMK59_3743, partial [Oryctes borbonicus]